MNTTRGATGWLPNLWWQQGLPGLVLLEADGHVPRDRPKVAHLLVTQMAGDTRGAELILALLTHPGRGLVVPFGQNRHQLRATSWHMLVQGQVV
eukprot:CAMPEP_0182579670 /NCGR_PEP_ID=MMETSP1324-20130603/44722_1 /TAXON_ID=236786 /ORGANISM="Florenciella sp., Strain RCC1587" /LENGTH=93 /DNA_ID=CAMNT_0024795797 /DNA_START=170 /DNA_END=448 /DNA_ORIENTATION=-